MLIGNPSRFKIKGLRKTGKVNEIRIISDNYISYCQKNC